MFLRSNAFWLNNMEIIKINLTKNQKKIIVFGGAGFLVFLALWLFLYLPSIAKIRNLKKELLLAEAQIQDIEKFLSGARDRGEAIQLLKQREQYLSMRFPQKEEEGLRILSELARKNNIEVISLEPGSKTEFLDESGKQLIIEGKIANYLPMTMEISCFYKDLLKYLSDLKADLPLFASVTDLNVKKDSQLAGRIRASVSFNLYLLI